MLVKARKQIAHGVLSGGLGGASHGDSRTGEEEYLTVEELSKRIRFSKQTIYNMISTKRFVRGQHYLKPSRKKVLFSWSAIRQWLEGGSQGDEQCTAEGESSIDHTKSRIHA